MLMSLIYNYWKVFNYTKAISQERKEAAARK
jgi:hypothetical protein